MQVIQLQRVSLFSGTYCDGIVAADPCSRRAPNVPYNHVTQEAVFFIVVD